ncbi:hypothetical protein [Nocardioides dongxiaopingii]|uniref:hypothetical protein n=1 Tax=Nocardioides dongxiaopingii TaxID=2576036 RepID=UPI00148579DB|nr:hypothetical protein [Nocardioides dongxiaopingii]
MSPDDRTPGPDGLDGPDGLADDALLAELGRAVAEEAAVTDRRREAARAAFTWRTVDAELADLLHDSALEAGAVRSAGVLDAVRTLSYGNGDVVLELEVDGDTVLGQVVGAGGDVVVATVVLLRRADGAETAAGVDPSGFFRFDDVAAGPARFVAGTLTTPWVVL